MKIIIEHDGGGTETYEGVTDYYLAVRRIVPATNGSGLAEMSDTKSQSRGANLRELAKEIAQSHLEIQDYLREQRIKNDGNS